jgi:cytochrome b
LRYIKTFFSRRPNGTPGHNPLGSLWIIAMLLIITAQGSTGLFIESEDFFEYGPLNGYVSDDTEKFMSGWHHTLPDVILIMVILHVVVVVFYLLWKKENLIKPMLSGWKWVRRSK